MKCEQNIALFSGGLGQKKKEGTLQILCPTSLTWNWLSYLSGNFKENLKILLRALELIHWSRGRDPIENEDGPQPSLRKLQLVFFLESSSILAMIALIKRQNLTNGWLYLGLQCPRDSFQWRNETCSSRSMGNNWRDKFVENIIQNILKHYKLATWK